MTVVPEPIEILRAVAGAATWRAFRVEVADARRFEREDALRAWIGGLGLGEGWVQWTDAVERFGPGARLAERAGLLALEACLDETSSVHVRHRGDGAWAAWRLVRRDGGGVGVRREFVAADGKEPLRYEVAFAASLGLDGVEALRPDVARFAGFGGWRD